jgi:hypothetical protein
MKVFEVQPVNQLHNVKPLPSTSRTEASIPAEKFVYTAGGRTNEHPTVAQCHARWGSHHFAQEPL